MSKPQWKKGYESGGNSDNKWISATPDGPKCPRCKSKIKSWYDGHVFRLGVHWLAGISCQATQTCGFQVRPDSDEGKAIIATIPNELLEWAGIFEAMEKKHGAYSEGWDDYVAEMNRRRRHP